MKLISFETLARFYAAARNYASLAIGFATSIGLISIAQQKTMTDGLSEIYAGISEIVHGAGSIWQVLVVVGGPFVAAVLAWYAQRSAKAKSSAAAIGANPTTIVNALPDGKATVLLTDPEQAKAALDAQKKAA
jgi:hypothetical protein